MATPSVHRASAETTSLTLLEAAKDLNCTVAWERLLETYTPRIYEACRRATIRHADIPDVCNDVWFSVARSLSRFETSSERKGQFRAWINKITKNKIIDYFRVRGKSEILVSNEAIDQLAWCEDAVESTTQLPDLHAKATQLMDAIEGRFGNEALRIFLRLITAGQDAAEVAREFGKSRSAIYVCKSRILHWLKTREIAR